MQKMKYTAEIKIEAAKRYLKGEGTYRSLAAEYGTVDRSLRRWVRVYLEQGEAGFCHSAGNTHYSKELKLSCVEAVLRRGYSVDEIVAKYHISCERVLRRWIMKYNANIELKDYEPKREVYMAEARRKTTLYR